MYLETLLTIIIKRIDISLFVQKPYLRTNYLESNIEEDVDLKNEHKFKNLPDPIRITEQHQNIISIINLTILV